MADNPKILAIQDLATTCQRLRDSGKTIAHCHGCFDLMHPGHIKYFEAAKAQADVLIVTVSPDHYVDKGAGRPAFNQELRVYSIAALACVDYVALNQWPTAVETLRLLRPDVYVKGQEFEKLVDATGKIQQEAAVVEDIGARLHFTQEIVFSSTKLLQQYFNVEDLRPPKSPYLSRRAEVLAALQAPQNLRVCVIGDSIIDEYHYCHPVGMASKSSIVAHRHLQGESHAGGACAIANHVAELCGTVHLISVLGAQHSREEFIRDHLNPKVIAKFFYRADAPSVVKRRYINTANQQKVFEVSSLPEQFMTTEDEAPLVDYFNQVLAEYDLVLVADYGHGFLSQTLINRIIARTRYLVVNTQTNSANSGFNLITRYPRADYVCLDENEARLAAHDRYGDIQAIAAQLLVQLQAQQFTITLGKQGCLIASRGAATITAPALETDCVDAIGSGDAFLSYSAPLAAAGVATDLQALIGNAAGALAVKIVGNRRPVSKQELIDFLATIF